MTVMGGQIRELMLYGEGGTWAQMGRGTKNNNNHTNSERCSVPGSVPSTF